VKPDHPKRRIGGVLYLVRHTHHGHDAVSPPVSARLAVETAVALAAAGRRVVVTDEAGQPIDVGELADALIRGAQG